MRNYFGSLHNSTPTNEEDIDPQQKQAQKEEIQVDSIQKETYSQALEDNDEQRTEGGISFFDCHFNF
jgi:hypothetical protein